MCYRHSMIAVITVTKVSFHMSTRETCSCYKVQLYFVRPGIHPKLHNLIDEVKSKRLFAATVGLQVRNGVKTEEFSDTWLEKHLMA